MAQPAAGYDAQLEMRHPIRLPDLKRLFWFTLGILALALGALGVVLPLLPTTPLVILASFAFAKSAPSFERWLRRHRIFGPIILDWQTHGAIAKRYKILAITMMLADLVLSFALAVASYVLILQALCMTGAAIYILTRPS